MSVEALKEKLKSGKIAGAYILYGEDEYTKDRFADTLRKAASSQFPEFNNTVLDAGVCGPSELRAELDRYPFMADTRLVELKNLDIKKLSDGDSAGYADAIAGIADFCTLLIVYRNGEFEPKSGKTKQKKANDIVDAVTSHGLVVNFEAPEPDKLRNWIIRHFKAEGTEIATNAADYLVEYCGNDLYILSGEIEKLCGWRGKGKVTTADIERVCCPNTAFRVFDLTKSILGGETKKALEIFANLKFYRVEPAIIFGTLSKFFAELALVKAGLDGNIPVSMIASKTGIADWSVKKYAAFLKAGNSGAYLRKAVRNCAEADMRMKSTGQDSYETLETLIVRISADG